MVRLAAECNRALATVVTAASATFAARARCAWESGPNTSHTCVCLPVQDILAGSTAAASILTFARGCSISRIGSLCNFLCHGVVVEPLAVRGQQRTHLPAFGSTSSDRHRRTFHGLAFSRFAARVSSLTPRPCTSFCTAEKALGVLLVWHANTRWTRL